MRFPESKIKAAILHPDILVRRRAVEYFTSSYSSDASIMPLIIQAVEKFGRDDEYPLVGGTGDLPQTAETIAWVLDELDDESCNRKPNYAYGLSKVLFEVDATLLLPIESRILES